MTETTDFNKLSVLLLAGHRPGTDPIAEYFNTKFKVTAPLAGKPMLMHTLGSLDAMDYVTEIYVISQVPEVIKSAVAEYPVSDKVRFVRGDRGIADSILSVWQRESLSTPLLVTTADNCLLRQEHVSDFLQQVAAAPADMCLGLVEKTGLITRYPESRRTWLEFKDVAVTGCNLFLIKNNRAENIINYWKAFESSPKKVFKLAWTVGPVAFIKFFFKRLELVEAFKIISDKSGSRIHPVKLKDPDVAIDADKVSDIVQIESILKNRNRQPGNGISGQNAPLVIFDLDRTITTHGTFLPFLIYFASRNKPLRLLLLPVVILMMLVYVPGIITRKQLKTIMQALLIGTVEKKRLDEICEKYVNDVLATRVNLDALFTIRQWQATGASLVIATASFDWMARCFARRLEIDNIVASLSMEKQGEIVPGIDGHNCYGDAKLATVEEKLGSLREIQASNRQVWFYTDHHSDIPLLELCSHPVAINPTKKLSNWVLINRQAQVMHWNTSTVSSSLINTPDTISESR